MHCLLLFMVLIAFFFYLFKSGGYLLSYKIESSIHIQTTIFFVVFSSFFLNSVCICLHCTFA